MGRRLACLLAGALAASAGEALYIVRAAARADPPPPGGLLGDPLFARSFDPAGQLAACRDRLEAPLDEGRRARFERQWDAWLRQGLEVRELSAEVRDTPTETVLSLSLPDVVAGSLAVGFEPGRVRLSYLRRGAGPPRAYQTVLPLPPEADPSRHRLLRDGDTVRIVFPRRLPQRPA